MEYAIVYTDDFLAHHGVKGMKWGVRRYQNADGTLTAAGKKRYNDDGTKKTRKQRQNEDYQRRLASYGKVSNRNLARLKVTSDEIHKYNKQTEPHSIDEMNRIMRVQELNRKAGADQVRLSTGKFARKLAKETEKKYGKAEDFRKVNNKDLYRNIKNGKTITLDQAALLRNKPLMDVKHRIDVGNKAAKATIVTIGALYLTTAVLANR